MSYENSSSILMGCPSGCAFLSLVFFSLAFLIRRFPAILNYALTLEHLEVSTSFLYLSYNFKIFIARRCRSIVSSHHAIHLGLSSTNASTLRPPFLQSSLSRTTSTRPLSPLSPRVTLRRLATPDGFDEGFLRVRQHSYPIRSSVFTR